MAVYHGKNAKLLAWDGNNAALTAEACTEVTTTAQITDTAKRILDPNETQTWTDSGGKNLVRTEYTIGKGHFDGNVTSVTITGKYVPVANLDQMANMFGWTIDSSYDLAEASVFGSAEKTWEAGLTTWTGSAEGFFLDSTWKDAHDLVKMWLVRFYIDAAHYYMGWAHITGISPSANVNELVTEPVTFNGYCDLSYA